MSAIELKASDVNEMREFYLEELERTLKRLEHIRKILSKIGEDGPTPDIASKGTTVGKKAPRKRAGRKSKWEGLIMKRLRQLDRPVTYDELTEEIMLLSKLPKEKKQSTRQAIVSVIFRLETVMKR